MKTIGLIGGMSWESTLSYYQIINRNVNAKLGGLHSAKIILHSVDFSEIAQMQFADNWQPMGQLLHDAAMNLQNSGADCVLICTNTMHKVADQVVNGLSIPLLHIADAAAAKLKQDGLNKVALLGTKFTMQQEFYKSRIANLHGIEVITPNDIQMAEVHRVIYDELCQGVISDQSKQEYLTIIDDLRKSGAQGVILGCTEIGLLVSSKDVEIPLYDTAEIHALAAVDFALAT